MPKTPPITECLSTTVPLITTTATQLHKQEVQFARELYEVLLYIRDVLGDTKNLPWTPIHYATRFGMIKLNMVPPKGPFAEWRLTLTETGADYLKELEDLFEAIDF